MLDTYIILDTCVLFNILIIYILIYLFSVNLEFVIEEC